MGKRRVVVDLYEEITIQSAFHTAEIEVDVDEAKDTLGAIETKAIVVAKGNLPDHIKERIDDPTDPLTIAKVDGKMRL